MKLNAKGPSLYAWSAVGNGEENSNLGAGGISYVMSFHVSMQIKSFIHLKVSLGYTLMSNIV